MPQKTDVIGENLSDERLSTVKVLDVFMKNGEDYPQIETVQVGNLVLPVSRADLSFDSRNLGTLTLVVSMHRVRLHLSDENDE